MRCLLYLCCFSILVALTGCSSKYHEEIPVIEEPDLEPGLYRMRVIEYSHSGGKIYHASTYLSAGMVPDCIKIIEYKRTLLCTSHMVRVIFNPRPWSRTANNKYLMESSMGGDIEISVRIAKKLGTKVERKDRDTVTFYEYEGIAIKNENYPDLIFEFEE